MKKIILAVASVLALGLVVGCKQQLEGSLNVTSTTYTKSLDQGTTKNFYYKATGAITTTETAKSEYKAAGTSATTYVNSESKTVTTYTPSADVKVVITENPSENWVKYVYTIPYTKEVEYTGTQYNLNATTTNYTFKYVYNKDNQNSTYAPYTGTEEITIWKIDGKYYNNAKAQDGSEIVVSEGFDPLNATVALSKFSDTTSTTEVTYTRGAGVSTTSTTSHYTNEYNDWTGKNTKTTGGKVSTLSLEKK